MSVTVKKQGDMNPDVTHPQGKAIRISDAHLLVLDHPTGQTIAIYTPRSWTTASVD